MPIEFRCTACNKLLRTPDDTAGKQAKCPECGALMPIPVPAGQPRPPAAGRPFAAGAGQSASSAAADAANPYRSPLSDAPRAFVPPSGSFTPSRIDFADVFGRTFRVFGQEWSTCILVFLAFMAIVLGFLACAGGAAAGVAVLANDEAVTVVVIIFAIGATWLFAAWLSIGMRIFFLKLARGDDARVGDLFGGGPFFVTTLLASLLFALAYLGGLVLFIVPGIIFGLMFSQFNYMIIDRNAGVVESLSLSKEFTFGNKLMLFVILLVANLVGQVIVQACAIGMIVVFPFLSLLNAVIYLVMTGQATADQRYPAGPGYYPATTAGSPFAPPAAGNPDVPKIGSPDTNNP
jgi:phage FluMu protein Com/uncharacterized membrane protein